MVSGKDFTCDSQNILNSSELNGLYWNLNIKKKSETTETTEKKIR